MEAHDAPAVVCWTLPKAKAAEQADTLAAAIADLAAFQHTVSDPETGETGETRGVRYGDIAVLATTNAHVEALALISHTKRCIGHVKPVKLFCDKHLTEFGARANADRVYPGTA